MNRTGFLHALVPLVFAAGCATVAHGTRQNVPIETDPPGATASADGQTITTPGVLTLDRRKEFVEVLVEKKGYVSRRVMLTRTHPAVEWPDVRLGVTAGDISSLFVGVEALPVAALGIDYATGAAYWLEPPKLVLRLEPAVPADLGFEE